MHKAKKEFYERMRIIEGQTPEAMEEKRKRVQKKIIAHKYGIKDNNKTDKGDREPQL